MAVCRFYLENRCRYGENCRFEHPRGGAQRSLFGGPSRDNWSGGGGGGAQVTFRDSFGTSGQGGGGNQFKWVANQQPGGGLAQPSAPLDIVNNLPKEMETWEKSRMWPFSCMSLEKDLPSLPEFQDVSVEEMRLEAYQAIQSGNLQPYTQKYQALMNEFQNKRAQLKHMNMDLKGKLVSIIEEGRKRRADQQGHAGGASVFGSPKPSGGGLFGQGQSTAGTGLFGHQSSTGMSGTGAGLFGKPSSTSTFGGNSPMSGSAFGSSPAMVASTTTSTFGSSGGSLFGKPMGSAFGGAGQPPASTTTNLFSSGFQNSSAGTQSVFGGMASQNQQASPSLFGGAVAPQSSFSNSPAASTTPQGLFGKPATFGQTGNTGSVFGNNSSVSQAPGLFSSPSTNTGSVFGNSMSAAQSSTPGFSSQGTGLFGKGPSQLGSGFTAPGAQATGLFGKGPPVQVSAVGSGGATSGLMANPGLYTPLADLTEAEKQAFTAKSFEDGKIPIRPPPLELIR